jgi:hypothetical protein
MKIEIYVDVEKLVKEAITEFVRENLVIINNAKGAKLTISQEPKSSVAISDTVVPPTSSGSTKTYEYQPRPGKRRSPEEIAMGNKELEFKRPLTPEEKGQVKADVEMAEKAEDTAKAEAIEKVRIDKLAKEGSDAAKAELEKESKAGVTPEEKSALTGSNGLSGLFTDESSKLDAEAAAVVGPDETEPEIPVTEDLGNIKDLFKGP